MTGWGLVWGGHDTVHAEPPLQTESPISTEEAASIADPKLEELKFFQKKWRCSIENESDENPKNQAYIWDMIRELNNLWYFAISYQEPKDVSEVETWGYNTILKKYGRTVLGNDGKFANFLSDGWQDGTITWQGSSVNMVKQTTDKHQIILTKTSEGSFTEVEQRLVEEEWSIISQKTCTLPEWQ